LTILGTAGFLRRTLVYGICQIDFLVGQIPQKGITSYKVTDFSESVQLVLLMFFAVILNTVPAVLLLISLPCQFRVKYKNVRLKSKITKCAAFSQVSDTSRDCNICSNMVFNIGKHKIFEENLLQSLILRRILHYDS
jgi:hypothetical protein